MYRLMLSAVTIEVSRMSLTSGANRWASRAVVILQLAAWSAVGVVLLQKGVSSLQKTSETKNATMFNASQDALSLLSKKSPDEDESDLSVIPLSTNSGNRGAEGTAPAGDILRKADLERRVEDVGPEEDAKFNGKRVTGKQIAGTEGDGRSKNAENIKNRVNTIENTDEPIRGKKQIDRSFQEDAAQERRAPDDDEILRDHDQDDRLRDETSLGKRENELKSTPSMNENDLAVPEDDPFQRIPMFSNSSEELIDPTETSAEGNTASTTSKTAARHENAWEARRKMRLSHLSGGGAAAAVAMVAVGAVMLVLGPAVIILRALDERRQERRFLKLSGQDDLPPSYEQATLMDEAPRYSTLSLNTIFGPPPPPSPSPSTARVHVV